MTDHPLDILTPQGYLRDIEDHPNLDVVMNLFRIPRAFAVSGFGDWNVGQHSFCVAFLALYWSRHLGHDAATRDRLMVLGLTHDLHESATGDILPGLKNPPLRQRLDEIQHRFLKGLDVSPEEPLAPHLKLLDMAAFLYEIRQAAALNGAQRLRLAGFFIRQKELLLEFAGKHGFATTETFLEEMGIARMEEG
ncbi:MAG: HD domain-containing protein [Deltaproteobacteria bacterium]|nr:HD domain-containing protein [Deltaproteobacteria bacterium]